VIACYQDIAADSYFAVGLLTEFGAPVEDQRVQNLPPYTHLRRS